MADDKTPFLTTRQQLNLEFRNLIFNVKREKETKAIINGVSGTFFSGQLTAILGPSGAGKTTLMNILAGHRLRKVSGDILVNGNPRDLKVFKSQSCYILQEDLLLPFLTVQEVMMDAAAFKMGDGVSLQEKKKVVSEILETLNMGECVFTRIGNLSGGEKKRLSIATESLTNPPIMFFDEPTSGLDSRSTYQCIKLLKSLSNQGHTIICTIHQPSAKIFEHFDSVYCMAEGHCIYQGPRYCLLQNLSNFGLECPAFHNPADFLLEIASGEYGFMIPTLATNLGSARAILQHDSTDHALILEKNVEQMKMNGVKNDFIVTERALEIQEIQNTHYPSSFCTQFSVILKRTFLSIVRDYMMTHLRVVAHILVGLLIGVLYYKIGNEATEVLSNLGYLFFSILFLVFTAMMPTITVFPLEMSIFIKEHLNHWYSAKSYYGAKTTADFPFQVLLPLIYLTIVYFMTGQPIEATRFLLFVYFSIMTSLVSQTVGLTIGIGLNLQQAIFLGPALTIPFLLFSGFFVKFDTIPVYIRWLTYFSYIRYGFEGCIIATYGLDRPPLHCSEAFCLFKHPSKIFETIGFDESFLLLDAVVLLVYFFVARILGYFILKWRLKRAG